MRSAPASRRQDRPARGFPRTVVGAALTALVLVSAVSGGAASAEDPVPSIAAFAPVLAGPGETVVLTGSGLSDVSGVTFGGVPAHAFTVISATTVEAVVAYGASGDVTVFGPGGAGSRSGFLFRPPTTYDFDHLPVGSVEGIDGWTTRPRGSSGASHEHRVLIPGVSAGSQNSLVGGHDGSRALRFPHGGASIGSMATRRDDANFSTLPIEDDEGHYVVEFEMQHPCWGAEFGLGYDADDDGVIAEATESGIRLRITNCDGHQRRLFLPDGTVADGTHAVGAFNAFQLLIDRAANAGRGSVSVQTRNLSSAGGWEPIAGLQDVDARFEVGGGRRDPTNWNAMLFRSESWDPSSLLDNITFRKVVPSARSATFPPTPLGESSAETITVSGVNLSGALTATLVGDFAFADGATSMHGVGDGAVLDVRFEPTALGPRAGTLTLTGDDHAGPIIIPLDGTGAPYRDDGTDGGGWELVAYGADARLVDGARLTGASGSYEPATRTGRANIDALQRFQEGGEVAITWNHAGFPTGGISSYDRAVAFPLPAPQTMALDAAPIPPAGSGTSHFSRIGTLPSQALVPVRNLLGEEADPGMPAEMYLRSSTFGVNYGNSYGLVRGLGANNQLDWSPDAQAFAAIYLGVEAPGSGAPPTGYVTPSGTGLGAVPSTMAVWVRPAQVSTVEGSTTLESSVGEIVADGDDAVTLSVRIRDVYGSAIARAGVPVTFSSTLGTFMEDMPVMTDSDGLAVATLTSTVAGSGTVSAVVESGHGASHPIGTPLTVSAVAGPAAALALVVPPPPLIVSGEDLAPQPVVRVEDAFGNAVGLGGIVVGVEAISADATLTGPASALTDSEGVATFSELALTAAPGLHVLRFTAPGLAPVAASVEIGSESDEEDGPPPDPAAVVGAESDEEADLPAGPHEDPAPQAGSSPDAVGLPDGTVDAISIACLPVVALAGAHVECSIAGGQPSDAVRWVARYNPTIDAATAVLDATGHGRFSFLVPVSAVGQEVEVHLVDPGIRLSLGVAVGPVPTEVPAGGGSLGPAILGAFTVLLMGLLLSFAASRVARASMRGVPGRT